MVYKSSSRFLGPLFFAGAWNAATNTPTLVSGQGDAGSVYIVSVSGSTNLDGITDWNVGDWAVFNGTVWEKIDNTDSVLSVSNIDGTLTISPNVGAIIASRAAITGEVSIPEASNIATVSNAAVIAKVLTGYVSGAGTVSATDSILQAIQKLNGNIAVGVSSVSNSDGTITFSPTTSAVVGSLNLANSNIWTARISVIGTYTNPSATIDDYVSNSTVSVTSAPYVNSFFGGVIAPTIGASNIQDWTGLGGLVGLSVNPSIAAGATGTFNIVRGIVVGGSNLNGGNVTTYKGAEIHHPVLSTGTIISSYGLGINAYTEATNNTHLLTGTLTAVSGNWNIYSSTAYNNYLGTGHTLIGSSTDVGSNILQITGTSAFSGKIAIGQTSGTSMVSTLNTSNTPLYDGVGTYTNIAGNITAITNSVTGNQTSGATSSFLRAQTSNVTIAATNTQNWTGTTGLVGMQNNVSITSGATGTITNATGVLCFVQNSSSGLTITNAYPLRVLNTVSTGGTITNGITGLFYGLGIATNNTGLYLATATTVPTAPSGNFAIYDTTGYVVYHAGKIGSGVITPSAQIHSLSTTEQLRLGYDASNYLSATISSTGVTTFDAVGASSSFIFSDSVAISGLTASTALVSDSNKNITSSTTTSTELGYVSGVTSAIQTQINAKGAGTVTSIATAGLATGGTITTTGTVTVTAAVKADMETATSTTTAVTPAVVQNHPGVAKVWVNYNTATTTTINASYNVSSLTDNGVGDTTINFTTAFSSGSYAVCGMGETASPNIRVNNGASTPTASAVRVLTTTLLAVAADGAFESVVIFGGQ